MTRPPDGPWDPNREHPETRAFDPLDDAPGSTGAFGRRDEPQAYTQASPSAGYGPPTYGAPAYGAPYGDQPPPPPPKKSGRTVGLVLAVLAAIVVLALVGFLIARGTGGSEDDGTAAPASSPTTTSSTTTTTTTTTTTEPTTTAPPRPTVAPGAVTYQITGNGDIVGLRFRSGNQFTVVAVAGSPWSQATTVTGGRAEISALVLRGPVTCSILHGEQLLASSTSNGGPLTCTAQLPSE